VLVVRNNLFRHEEEWRASEVHYSPDITFD